MLGYDLTFLTYKLPNFGGFEWEIFPNFGTSEIIETFLSENFRNSWFFLSILTYKIKTLTRTTYTTNLMIPVSFLSL